MHILSHDMKTPLTSLIGYAHVLERTAELDGRALHFVHQIHQAAERMQEMLVRLLRTVDATSTVQIEMGTCDLVPLVEKVIRDTEGAALRQSIELSLMQEGTPSPITADQTRLYHALLNIVDNAIKFAPARSQVVIELAFEPEQVRIRVKDEGPGVSADDLPHLFQKHYRGRNTGDETGSGLGLYLVQGTVEAHGGTIQVQNRPEGGAVFEVFLPRNRDSS
jgi:signal transduction histidine kinase